MAANLLSYAEKLDIYSFLKASIMDTAMGILHILMGFYILFQYMARRAGEQCALCITTPSIELPCLATYLFLLHLALEIITPGYPPLFSNAEAMKNIRGFVFGIVLSVYLQVPFGSYMDMVRFIVVLSERSIVDPSVFFFIYFVAPAISAGYAIYCFRNLIGKQPFNVVLVAAISVSIAYGLLVTRD